MNELYGANSYAIVCLKRRILSYNNGVHSILYWVLFYCSGAVARTSLLLLLPFTVLLFPYGNPVAGFGFGFKF